uniref:Transmembrane protein 230 n=19 Tax=Euarchontoglires TaxID=314146 RepID=A0A2K6EIL2_PROCO
MQPRAPPLPSVGELSARGALARFAVLPGLESCGISLAHSNLKLLGSSDPPASASQLCQCVMMPSRTNLATGIPSSKVKYSRLSSTDDGYIDLQFKKSPPKIPYKAIALATVLFLIGAFLIIIGSLLLSGYISKGGADRAVPVLIIGILVFLPGFYHLRIAYYASKGYRGYSYDDIPDFDD